MLLCGLYKRSATQGGARFKFIQCVFHLNGRHIPYFVHFCADRLHFSFAAQPDALVTGSLDIFVGCAVPFALTLQTMF